MNTVGLTVPLDKILNITAAETVEMSVAISLTQGHKYLDDQKSYQADNSKK